MKPSQTTKIVVPGKQGLGATTADINCCQTNTPTYLVAAAIFTLAGVVAVKGLKQARKKTHHHVR